MDDELPDIRMVVVSWNADDEDAEPEVNTGDVGDYEALGMLLVGLWKQLQRCAMAFPLTVEMDDDDSDENP